MIALDTSVLYALLDRRDGLHRQAVEWYEDCEEELATTPLVLAETDHLARPAGVAARKAFRADVAAGAYAIEWWPGAAAEAVEVATRYDSLDVSLTDASLVALAARLESPVIATFDERHFRAMAPLTRHAAFRLLPADAR